MTNAGTTEDNYTSLHTYKRTAKLPGLVLNHAVRYTNCDTGQIAILVARSLTCLDFGCDEGCMRTR